MGGAEGGDRGQTGERTGQQPAHREFRSLPRDQWRAEEEGGLGYSVSVSSLCSLAHFPPPLAAYSSSPPLLCLRQPLGSVWLIKEEEGSRHDAVCLGPFAPARPGTRSKGPSVELPLPSLPLSAPASPHPPAGILFCEDETAGLLGQAGPGIRIRLARVGWQMAA